MAGMQITHLFLDIGNVILTNGWDRRMRQQAAAVLELDYVSTRLLWRVLAW
jgi:hypothetical protein